MENCYYTLFALQKRFSECIFINAFALRMTVAIPAHTLFYLFTPAGLSASVLHGIRWMVSFMLTKVQTHILSFSPGL